MHYFLDCEFDAFNGPLISLALVRQDGASLYLIYKHADEVSDPWVRKNVVPLLHAIPAEREHCKVSGVDQETGARLIAEFLKGDPRPYVVADWPDDIAYFCKAILTSPGNMASIPNLRFEIVRVRAYPTDLPGAIQHNAWWDAMALRDLLTTST